MQPSLPASPEPRVLLGLLVLLVIAALGFLDELPNLLVRDLELVGVARVSNSGDCQ